MKSSKPYKRSPYRPSTIFITFKKVADEAIELLLEEAGVLGFRVGTVVNRYAVEIPFGQEKEYVEFFYGHELIHKLFPHYIEGELKKTYKRHQK